MRIRRLLEDLNQLVEGDEKSQAALRAWKESGEEEDLLTYLRINRAGTGALSSDVIAALTKTAEAHRKKEDDGHASDSPVMAMLDKFGTRVAKAFQPAFAEAKKAPLNSRKTWFSRWGKETEGPRPTFASHRGEVGFGGPSFDLPETPGVEAWTTAYNQRIARAKEFYEPKILEFLRGVMQKFGAGWTFDVTVQPESRGQEGGIIIHTGIWHPMTAELVRAALFDA